MKELRRRLGLRIREVRRARGLTQEELAERVGISPRYLSRVEVGQQNPSIQTVAQLATALDIELSELFNFGHLGTEKELRQSLRRLTQERDVAKLRLALKVFSATLR